MAHAVIVKEMLVSRALTNRKRPPHRDLASVKRADLWEVAIGEKQNFRRMTFLRFNRLYVIKSLAADEVPTGTILFEYLQPVIDAAACTLPMGLYKCHDAQGFRDIAAEVLVNSLEGHLPWIHLPPAMKPARGCCCTCRPIHARYNVRMHRQPCCPKTYKRSFRQALLCPTNGLRQLS